MSNKPKLLIYGASGHAKVIFDAAFKHDEYEIMGFLDDKTEIHGSVFMDLKVLGGYEFLEANLDPETYIVLGIGMNNIREKIDRKLQSLDAKFATIIHPSAQIATGVQIGEGTVIMGGVVVNTDTQIGRHAILNTGSTIDHDCKIGDFAHISPGANLAGGVKIGALSQMGIGSSAIPGVEVGEKCVIGAGAAVIGNIPDEATAVGVPAKVISK